MRSRRIMHGKRRKRSSCLKKTEEISIAVPEQNYEPTGETVYNPMDAGADRLKDKNMNIEREEL